MDAARRLSEATMAGGARNVIAVIRNPSIGQPCPNPIFATAQIDTMYRYIMSMAVADHTGQAWLQGFNDVGVAVFGKTADELHEIKV